MAKKSLIISYRNMTEEVMEAMQQTYPYGFESDVEEITNHKNEVMHVIRVETSEANYLVKVTPGEEKKVDYFIKDVLDAEQPKIKYEYKGENEAKE